MYKINGSGVVRVSDGAIIPGDVGNSDYVNYLSWLEDGNTPEPETHQAGVLVSEEGANARAYRDSELARSDIMLNRIQDGETGLGTQKAWRAYRVELRNWPETASFPLEQPVAPDAK